MQEYAAISASNGVNAVGDVVMDDAAWEDLFKGLFNFKYSGFELLLSELNLNRCQWKQ